MPVEKFGKGVEVDVKGKKVTVTFDLTKDYGPSSSGKTNIIATTSGNAEIADGVFMGLNVYKKA